jgi:hypothetical protein
MVNEEQPLNAVSKLRIKNTSLSKGLVVIPTYNASGCFSIN